MFNKKLNIDCFELLQKIDDNKVKITFFDPQYRGVMDKLDYGNEGARQIERAALQQMNEDFIKKCINEISRVLVPSGYLFLWIDKFHLVEGSPNQWIEGTQLKKVDLITWNKLKMGMGYRTRRVCEYLLILQKEPIKAKATWTNHGIRDVIDEKIENKIHPHQKPKQLTKTLIEATTKEGDLVLDPCAGSFLVYDVCFETGRQFIGTDIKFGEVDCLC